MLGGEQVGNPFSCCEKDVMAPVGENLFKFGDTVYCADKGQVGIVFSALSPKLIHPYSVGFADGSSDVFAEHELVLVERPKA